MTSASPLKELADQPKPSVGSLINLYPDFQFDLEEYICSLRYSDWLENRLALFKSYLVSKQPTDHETLIVDSLKNTIANTTPAYTGLSGIKTYKDIPFINRDSIRNDPTRFLNRQFTHEVLWCKTTSGTTGTPITFYYSPAFYFEQVLLSVPKLVARARVKDTVTNPVICMHITDTSSSKTQVIAYPNNRSGIIAQVVINQSEPETIGRLCELIGDLKPAIITSRPELLEVLVEQYSDSLIRNSHRPLFIISSGSLLNEERRGRFQEFFGAKVFNAYGLTEFGLVASECPFQSGLHLDETLVHAEVVDELGKPAREGEVGELVLSSIANPAMPLLRYRTGDRASLMSGVCDCKSPGKRIGGISGREVPCFRFKSGDLFSPTYFNNLFSLFPITEYQITQLSLNQVEVLVQLNPQVESIDVTLEKIGGLVRNALPVEVDVTVNLHRFTYGAKFNRYRTLM